MHSMVEFDRPRLLRMAAETLSPGGTLLIVDHAGPPPWASKLHHHHEFPSAGEVVASLDLDETEFERVRVEAVGREATGPDGQVGTLTDNVIVLRRRERLAEGFPRAVAVGHTPGTRAVSGRDGIGFGGEEHPVPDVSASSDRAQRRGALEPSVGPRCPVTAEEARSRRIVGPPVAVHEGVPFRLHVASWKTSPSV